MADEREMKQARIAFASLCEMLDSHKWHYEKDENDLTIYTGAAGDDLPIPIKVQVDPDKQLVSLYSKLPLEVPEEDRIMAAIAVCSANYSMVDGNFDYNLGSGQILFRLTSSIRESLIGKDMFEYMVFISCGTIDNYNDKFDRLFKHEISLEEFLAFSKEG